MKITIPKKPIIALGYVFLFFIIIAFSFGIYFRSFYKDRVLPNVYFYGENMGSMSVNEVEKIVLSREGKLKNSIMLKYEEKQIKIDNLDEIGFSWDRENTINYIMETGRNRGVFNNFYNQILSLFYRVDISLAYNFSEDKAEQYLEELATTINVEPVDGKLEIKNNKVVAFNLSNSGKKLMIGKSIINLKKSLIENESETELIVEEIKAKNSTDIERLGIKELFATGESNFYGSPPNRVHNIKQGSTIFDGVLIAPGEIFSFNKTLGEVSAATGFLPELVIKEDKTIPEYGGGLCQVSTTFFRTALNAGFPIIERTPHAYRVMYYEPAGMDATVYDPYPDLKFQNDSAHYILLQTRVEGNNLYVDFYGTSDSRKVEVYPPIIYNFVQPGEPIEIETEELEPGEKRQIDTAHVGADAYFTRKIIYADGETKEERFDSHYIPWRAKFEVGKEIAEEEEEEEGDSEEESIDSE